MTPQEAAESLYGAATPSLSAETLEAYGLRPGEALQNALSRELLALSLFWIQSAVSMMQKPAHARLIMDALRARVTGAWQSEPGHATAPEVFWREWTARAAVYDRLNRDGAGPPGVCAEAADRLVSSGVVADPERQAVMALFLDLVPVEELGELAMEIRLTN